MDSYLNTSLSPSINPTGRQKWTLKLSLIQAVNTMSTFFILLDPPTMLEHFFGHCGTLQGFWTFMDPDPQMDPVRLILGVKSGRAGPKIINFPKKLSRQQTNLNLQPGLRSIRHLVPEI